MVFPHFKNTSFIHKYDIADDSWTHHIGYGGLKLFDPQITIDQPIHHTLNVRVVWEYSILKRKMENSRCCRGIRRGIVKNMAAVMYCPSPVQQLHLLCQSEKQTFIEFEIILIMLLKVNPECILFAYHRNRNLSVLSTCIYDAM